MLKFTLRNYPICCLRVEEVPPHPFQKFILSTVSPAGRRARLTILTFHRILDVPDPLLPGEPDTGRFSQIVSWVRELCQVLPLEEAIKRLQRGELPARAAAITFDDGYRNNLTLAKPVLAAAGLPATVFVAAEAVRRGIMWNDCVIEGVRKASGRYDLGDLGLGILDVDERNRARDLESLIRKLKYRPLAEREEISHELHRRLAGCDPPRLMLTEDEVSDLVGNGVAVGAHTMRHPILQRLPDDEANWEIAESRSWLAGLTGKSPALFAYPNGRVSDDYVARHTLMVRDAGYQAGLTTNWGAASARSNVYELPRYTPWEQTRSDFQSRVLKTTLLSYTRSAQA